MQLTYSNLFNIKILTIYVAKFSEIYVHASNFKFSYPFENATKNTKCHL